MRSGVLIFLGSALGGVARAWVDKLVLMSGIENFPLGTLLVNLVGSFVVGWLAGRWFLTLEPEEKKEHSHFWIVGFCGGFTTFSTYAMQVFEMIESGHGQIAGLYAAGSMAGGIFAVWLGVSLAYKKKPGFSAGGKG